MGQGGRDDFKLRALKLLGLLTWTIDDKHDSVQNIHIRANFNITGDLIQGIARYLGVEAVIDIAELDYLISSHQY